MPSVFSPTPHTLFPFPHLPTFSLLTSAFPSPLQLKLRNVVTTQQEKLLGEKEVALEKQTQEIQSLKDSLTQKQEEVGKYMYSGRVAWSALTVLFCAQIQKLEESVQSLRGKLEESRELLKTNENGMCVCVCMHACVRSCM